MPSTFRFDKQDAEYKESVLPAACTQRIAVEAGVSDYWYKYVGLAGKVIGIDSYGLSAPGDQVLEQLGVTKEAVVAAAKSF